MRSLRFEGNTTFKSDELAIHVVTTPSSFTRRYFGWFFNAGSARCLPEDGLGQDVANLKGFYKNNGFYATKSTLSSRRSARTAFASPFASTKDRRFAPTR